MKRIIFTNIKGGVAKTSSAVNVAHILATKFNKRVLLVDLDAQMNLTTTFTDIDFTDNIEKILSGDIVKLKDSIEDVLVDPKYDIHQAIRKTKYENIDIIPSDLSLQNAERVIGAVFNTPPQFFLRNQLAKCDEEYDFCIIDTAPSMSIISVNGLVAADEVYIPLRSDDAYSMYGAALLWNHIKDAQSMNPSLKIGGFFTSMWTNRTKISKVGNRFISAIFSEYALPFRISHTTTANESVFVKKPLFEMTNHNKNKSAAAYLYFAARIAGVDIKESYVPVANANSGDPDKTAQMKIYSFYAEDSSEPYVVTDAMLGNTAL